MECKSLIIQASNCCPCYCPGCYNHFSDKEISREQIVNFTEEYIHKFGVKKVTVSGGDPLMRKDIIELLDELLGLQIDVSVDTVGLELNNNQALIEVLKRVYMLGLPLDGTTDETLSTFRKGLLISQLLRVIRLSSDSGLRICINTTVHAKNLQEIESIAQCIDEIGGIKKWQLFQYMPIGPRGSKNADHFFISDKVFKNVNDQVHQFSFHRDIAVECKSLSSRKNKYILLGADGFVWYPEQTSTITWDKERDANANRVVVGHIGDDSIFERISEVIDI